MKNKRHSAKAGGSKRGRGTSKTPVFGILCRGRKVWAQVVDDVEAKTLLPLISRWVELGRSILIPGKATLALLQMAMYINGKT